MQRKIFDYNNLTSSKIVTDLRDKTQIFDCSVSAAGCLFYRQDIHDDKIYLLLISYTDPRWPKLDDFGGKVDLKDKTIFSTIKREAYEESNGKINFYIDDFNNQLSNYDDSSTDESIASKEIDMEKSYHMEHNLKQIIDNEYYIPFYTFQSKYYIILIQVEESFFPETDIFGDHEQEDKIERYVKWYKFDDVKNQLAERISNNKSLMQFLKLKNSGII